MIDLVIAHLLKKVSMIATRKVVETLMQGLIVEI